MKPILQAIDIKKEYRSGTNITIAVDHVQLSIHQGEKIAITGPSGCGKTTLLNMLGLLTKPTSGQIFINSYDSQLLSEKDRAKMRNSTFGYVVQDFALIENYTAYENVEIPLRYSKEKKNKHIRRKMIMEVLDQLGIKNKIDQKVRYLSGGETQRVAIARAMINNPNIILADEPTGSLDSKTGESIMELLSEVASKGKTLILVTHDESLAKKCDTWIRMKDGKIL